ncbi:MAG: S-formylglutathione hydrolase [Arenimonas sp.]
MEIISRQYCFGGTQGLYQHESVSNHGPMRFSVFSPPHAQHGKVPVLFFLAGLTCNEETFMIKAGAQRMASELGIMLVAPDTSPRNTPIDDAIGDWEFGEGAGFYLNATQEKYRRHFNMHDYVATELPDIIAKNFPVDITRLGICGHSMGGHGALTLALRYPEKYRSVSAFAPIVAPSHVAWGQKAFSKYLNDENEWSQYDATELVKHKQFKGTILIDQGLDDKFLANQLKPELFAEACRQNGQMLHLRQHEKYDHSYWFIQSFIEDHLKHHAMYLLT